MRKILYLILIIILLVGCSSKNQEAISPKVNETQIKSISDAQISTPAEITINKITSSAINEETAITSTDIKKVENPKVVSKRAKNNYDFNKIKVNYKHYLDTLDKKDINSILYGIQKYKIYVSDKKFNNDKLFDIYNDFYSSCLYRLDTEKYWSYSNAQLAKFGLLKWDDDGQRLISDKEFMYDKFSNYLSCGKKDYLRLSIDYDSNNYFRDTVIFVSTFDEFSDSIIAWENYATKYKNNVNYREEVNTSSKIARQRLIDYLNTHSDYHYYIFEDGCLTEEAQNSYLRFVNTYPKSNYNQILKDYYDILKSNKFIYNQEAEDFLKSHKLYYKDKFDE